MAIQLADDHSRDVLLHRLKRVAATALRAEATVDHAAVRALRQATTPNGVLELFPLVTKTDLTADQRAIRTADHDSDHLDVRTSGSSGGVLALRWQRNDLVRSRRSLLRTIQAVRVDHQLPPNPRRPLLAMGASLRHVSTQVFALASDDLDEPGRVPVEGPLDLIVERVLRYTPDHLTTYPSLANEVLAQAPHGWFQGVTIALGGEHASRDLKARLRAAGAIVVDTYGCTEVGIIGLERPGDQNLQIQQNDVIVEVLDLPRSRTGYHRIAVTGLHNTGSPVVRYVLDDKVRVSATDGPFVTALAEVAQGSDPTTLRLGNILVPTRAVRGLLDSVLQRGAYRVTVEQAAMHVEVESDAAQTVLEIESVLRGALNRWGADNHPVNVSVVRSVAGGKTVQRFAVAKAEQ